jgi:hypothetical protein
MGTHIVKLWLPPLFLRCHSPVLITLPQLRSVFLWRGATTPNFQGRGRVRGSILDWYVWKVHTTSCYWSTMSDSPSRPVYSRKCSPETRSFSARGLFCSQFCR